MLVLTVRTDSSEAQLGLCQDGAVVAGHRWEAGRQLSKDLHTAIEKLLTDQNKIWTDLGAIVAFKGPGSFTGLRIGLTVANTLAHALSIPIVSSETENWIEIGLKRLKNNENEVVAMPEYGAEANITKPR
jgi:tRNA threonylcarbamoyladenosine biosynthesis protein TsaB